MSDDAMTEITVECPSDRAMDVARKIAATHLLTTRLPDYRFVAVGTKSGVHSMEATVGPPVAPPISFRDNEQVDRLAKTIVDHIYDRISSALSEAINEAWGSGK